VPAIAYFFTFTTYGTRLHGDGRGTVDRWNNGFGDDYLGENDRRHGFERERLKQPPYIMDETARACVDRAIRDHCAFRGWRQFALNVRSNHVHIVETGPFDAEAAMNQCKAWSTRRLREAGLVRADQRVWTRHGSTRHLFKPHVVESAVRYTLEGQDGERWDPGERNA